MAQFLSCLSDNVSGCNRTTEENMFNATFDGIEVSKRIFAVLETSYLLVIVNERVLALNFYHATSLVQ